MVFFSFGENIPHGRSSVPEDGFAWQRTRQPIVLEEWPVTPPPTDGLFTSVLLWEAYPPVTYAGRTYAPKSASFGPFLDLPGQVGSDFELAFGGRTQPSDMMKQHGWRLTDPRVPTRTLSRYQQFIQHSKAEFGIAKHGYVVSRSGWFSERSAAYLASGRPVIVQETGFSDWVSGGGAGVLPFETVEQAVAAIDSVNRGCSTHARRAREVAEACFDSRDVLSSLLEAAMSGSAS